MIERICTKCGETKPLTDFHLDKRVPGKGKTTARCKDCNNADSRTRNKARPRSYWAVVQRRSRLKKQYGLTEEMYDTLFERQQGVCAICGRPETGTSGPTRSPRTMAVDHDHVTGAVRGLLCHPCNAAIGLLQEDPVLLRVAADYLECGGWSRE